MEENHPKSPIFRKRSNLKTKSTDKEEEEIEFFPATPQKYSRAAETVKSYRLMLEKKILSPNIFVQLPLFLKSHKKMIQRNLS